MKSKLIPVTAALTGLLWGCSSSTSPSGDAAAACPQSVQQRCAQGDSPVGEFGVHCVPTLAAAEADPYFCASFPGAREETCGSYTAVVVTNVDFSYLYYYDASGALIAIASNGLVNGMQCLGGLGGFVLPLPCTDIKSLPACAVDAGGGS